MADEEKGETKKVERGLGRGGSVSALAEAQTSTIIREDESPLAPLKKKIRHVYIRYPLVMECMAEFLGTFVFIIFGICSVSTAAIMGAQQGLWQVVVVWGFGLSLAIYAAGPISGGHLNPAVSFAFALLRPKSFPLYKLGPYILAQVLGAFMAGVFNLLIYGNAIVYFEKQNNIIRGAVGSERSAMVFGEYFPNPSLDPSMDGVYGVAGAFFVEMVSTALFMFLIMSLTSPALPKEFRDQAAPFFIGFSVASIMSLTAPITQGCLNPARDFGPRLVSAMAGWGTVAIPGPNNGFWIYIVGPMIGAPIGGAIRDLFMETAY